MKSLAGQTTFLAKEKFQHACEVILYMHILIYTLNFDKYEMACHVYTLMGSPAQALTGNYMYKIDGLCQNNTHACAFHMNFYERFMAGTAQIGTATPICFFQN